VPLNLILTKFTTLTRIRSPLRQLLLELHVPLIHRIERGRRVDVSIYNNHYPHRSRNRFSSSLTTRMTRVEVYACLRVVFVDIDLLAMTETVLAFCLPFCFPRARGRLSRTYRAGLSMLILLLSRLSLPLWQRHSPGARTRNVQRASEFRTHVHPKLRVKDYARQGISSENIPRETPHRNSCNGARISRPPHLPVSAPSAANKYLSRRFC